MLFSQNKTMAIAITILFLTSALLSANISINAQTADTPTYAFIVADPNPIGVGQTALVTFWMSDITPNSVGSTGDFYSGVTVTITTPDNTTSTMGPYTLNSLASGYFDYVPEL